MPDLSSGVDSGHERSNPLKAMGNRTGKREREARSRSKRGWSFADAPDGTVLRPLKLGRKKRWAFSRSTRFAQYRSKCFGFSLAAVPVAEAERRVLEIP